jgi:hypothetical protein
MNLKEKKEDINVFEENRKLGGYNVLVMDDWGFKIKKRHIKEEQKEQYIKTFGHKIITDTEFFNWWKKINNNTV